MNKNKAIRHKLREVSKQSKKRCANCKWYLKSNDVQGDCKEFLIPVNNTQLCDLWVEGYVGIYNEKLIREYQQNLEASIPYKEHPKSHTPSATYEDYDSKYLQRYFVKYKSSIKNPITEVNEKTFKSLSDAYYSKMELRWKISGPKESIIKNGAVIDKGIAQANKDTIKLKERNFRGIKDYLTDYTELAYKKVKKSSVNPRSTKKKRRKSVYGSGKRPPIK